MLRDIFNTYRQAFRSYIRNRTIPVSYEEAEEKRLFWSKCYSISAVISLIFVTYLTAKRGFNFPYRTDIDKDKAILEAIGTGEVRVYKYKGFTKVAEYDYLPSEMKKEKDIESEKE